MNTEHISRRVLLKRVAALGMLTAVERLVPAYAVTNTIVNPGSQTPLSGDVIDLTVSEELFRLDEGRTGRAMTINGTIPGPVIRLKEGQQATLRVTNRLELLGRAGYCSARPSLGYSAPLLGHDLKEFDLEY
jgi:FtsP/CotA-like multicopper oxidase with cupredoxin domain